MAKVLALSDPHYHNYKSHSTTVDGVNSRCLDIDNAMEAAMKFGKQMKVDLFTMSGDIFHERGRIRPSVFNRVFNRFAQMAAIAPVAINIGNHDMEDFNLGASSVDTFESISGCHVFGGSKGYSHLTVRGLEIVGIQYFHKPDEFKRVFEEAMDEWKHPAIVMIHQGVDDFGLPGIPETQITASYLKSKTDAWVLCGHYHSAMRDGEVISVGAPLQHSFGDEGDERGFWMIDTDDDIAAFYPLAGITPRFVTVKDKADVKGVKGNFVRVMTSSQRTASTLEKAALSEGALSVIKYVNKEYAPAHAKTVAISTDPKKMIADFCKLDNKYAPHEAEIIKMWEQVCV